MMRANKSLLRLQKKALLIGGLFLTLFFKPLIAAQIPTLDLTPLTTHEIVALYAKILPHEEDFLDYYGASVKTRAEGLIRYKQWFHETNASTYQGPQSIDKIIKGATCVFVYTLNKKTLGFTEFSTVDGQINLAVAIAPSFRKKGLGKKIVENAIALYFKKASKPLIWRCEPANKASEKIPQKQGFRFSHFHQGLNYYFKEKSLG